MTFHLVAFFCVVAALVSAAVSAYPRLAFLKTMSLLLLFLYGSSGARVAVMGRETRFFLGIIAGLRAAGLHFGNFLFHLSLRDVRQPKLLGRGDGSGGSANPAVGNSDERTANNLAGDAHSLSRSHFYCSSAAMLARASPRQWSRAFWFASLCVDIGLLAQGVQRRPALGGIRDASVVPLHQQPSESLTSVFLYKGRREDGILASRRPIWDETVSAIQEHPWLGSGFGTSPTSSEVVRRPESFESFREATREHGNSYLAITEWVGFAGDVPFFALILLLSVNVARALRQMHRTGNVFSPVIPLAGVLTAGLVHAAFEDWLFAPGYYLCVFFWTLAFIMVDVLPAAEPSLKSATLSAPRAWTHGLGTAALGR